MWHPWTFGMAGAAFTCAVGIGVWFTRSQGLSRVHGWLLLPMVAWTLVGAGWVMMREDVRVFDQGMALGLLAMIGLTGYASPKRDDPNWARAMHGILGGVIVAWYAVMAHRYGEW
jgi:hypothetical protein